MGDVTTHDLEVLVDGAALSDALASTLLELEVDTTYNRPDLCLLRFNLQPNEDPPAALDLARELKVSVKGRNASDQKKVIFLGEVTAIEFEFMEGFAVCLVQGQDVMHRLFRGNKHAVFLKKTYSDIASTVIRESGLQATVDATTVSHDHLIQHDETTGDFLTRLAREINYHVKVEDKKVQFKKVASGPATGVTLEYGQHLLSFGARATAAGQLTKATVRGWDHVKKEKTIGEASAAVARKDSKVSAAVNTMKGTGEVTLASEGVKDQLDAVAKTVMERAVEPNLQVEGVCFGEPKLKVDQTVQIDKVGTRFDGEYRLSRVRHRYSATQGFRTEFSCRGATDQSLSELVAHTASSERSTTVHGRSFDGCAIGIVTNNEDKEGKLGRVKVKFPTLDDQIESHWYRLVLPGAGGSGGPHGWYLLPEVNDEVLVIFERSDPRLGYVIGGLFNGVDKPPVEQGKVVTNGKVDQHAFYTKKGAFLLFDDKEGAEAIQMKSKSGDFDFRFEETKGLTVTNKQSGNVITVTADGDITIESKQGNINLKADAGDIVMKAKNIKAEASMNVEMKANSKFSAEAKSGGAEMKGLTATVEGQTSATLKSSANTTVQGGAITEVKGTLVKIN